MQAGKLRHVIELQQSIDSVNTTGQVTKNWATVATVRANVKPKSVSEFTKENM